ncbi:hypothetical protein GCM10009836_55280 [Pseudonocardia ailaonensis]|uniref:NADH:flavin oxidoreductase/NADH oxidase N-terminal domain-containing protein n=1 Tax=Pseudonocardia ailaonensis TaxID=367279 RepID=A0ABN2NG93_9PSEU
MLGDPVPIGSRRAPSRVLFGPHVTNLGRGRTFSERHAAYYAERAAGGCGVIVCETASVHPSDRPYERAPVPGWAGLKAACGDALVLASLGHSGSQGTSAFTGQALWGASRVQDVVSREVPSVMEPVEIDALVSSFAAAAARAVEDGLDGVEVNAGQHSLLRQFLSGLTNTRSDAYGDDRTLLLREVLTTVRAAVGDAVVGLRLGADELAPWAGITPDLAESWFPPRPWFPAGSWFPPGPHDDPASSTHDPAPPPRESALFDPRVGTFGSPHVRSRSSGGPVGSVGRGDVGGAGRGGIGVAVARGEDGAAGPGSAGAPASLAGLVDYLVPVRGSGLSVSATRPDSHTPPGFNRDLARRFLGRGIPVVLQGSVVDPGMAAEALDEGFAMVEMTRAQIADPRLVAHVRAGTPERIRPCTLTNQHRARDPRNPLITDEAEPRSGHETLDPPLPVDPLSVDPLSVDPLSVDPLSVDPLSVDPLSVDPLSVDPLPVEPLSLEPLSDGALPAEPLPADRLSAEALSVDRLSAEPLSVDRLSAEPLLADPLPADPLLDATPFEAPLGDAPPVAEPLSAGPPLAASSLAEPLPADPLLDARRPVDPPAAEPLSGDLRPRAPAAPGHRRGSRLPGEAPVFVVGGGPAGLEAARTAALMGRRVVVCERSMQLGGALRLAALLPGRERFGLLVDWWERELARLGVEVRLGTAVTAADLHDRRLGGIGADIGTYPAEAAIMLVATGSIPSPPTFAVGEGVLVVHAAEFESAVLAGAPSGGADRGPDRAACAGTGHRSPSGAASSPVTEAEGSPPPEAAGSPPLGGAGSPVMGTAGSPDTGATGSPPPAAASSPPLGGAGSPDTGAAGSPPTGAASSPPMAAAGSPPTAREVTNRTDGGTSAEAADRSRPGSPLARPGPSMPHRLSAVLPAGARVVVHDPVGDWTGVGIAEQVAAAGFACALVTPDAVPGTQLARTGDLAAATARLERAGVERVRFSRLRSVGGGSALVVDVHHGAARAIPCTVVIDCAHRLPDETLDGMRVGDCVAPRTVHEAVREGRRAAQRLCSSAGGSRKDSREVWG